MGHIKLSSPGVSLVVLLPLLWEGITCQVPGYSITAPPSVSVQEGLCVTIPCNFTAAGRNNFTNSTGYWKSSRPPNDTVATNDKSIAVIKPNFHLTGNPDKGDCTLTITDARREDTGEYYYRFEESKDSPVRYNYYNPSESKPTITVTDLTEEPVISDLGPVIAGVDKTLTCSPPGNCPATSLVFQWKKSNVAGIWKKNSSTITFTPNLCDYLENITCEMTNSKGTTTQKSIPLVVLNPAVSITITWKTNGKQETKPDSMTVDEGSSGTLRCSVQSDLRVNVTWMDEKNNVLQNGTGKDLELELRLENVTMNHTGVYTCTAINEYVTSSRNISVNVQYPPRNLEIIVHSSKGEKPPESHEVAIDQDETLTLICRAEGNPTVTVVWVKGNTDIENTTMSSSGSSAVINVTSSMADVYQCLAWNVLGLRGRWIQVGSKQAVCTNCNLDSSIIIGMVIGNIVALTLIVVGSYFYMKRRIDRRQSEKESPDPKTPEPESAYEDLRGETNDYTTMYYNIKTQ